MLTLSRSLLSSVATLLPLLLLLLLLPQSLLGITIPSELSTTHIHSQDAPLASPVPAGRILNNPAASDLIIIATYDGEMHGMQRSTGKLLWTTPAEWGPLINIVTTTSNPVWEPIRHLADSDTNNSPGESAVPAQKQPDDPTLGHSPATQGRGGTYNNPHAIQDPAPGGDFTIEASGNGDMFLFSRGDGVEKFRLSIKDVVDQRPSFVYRSYAFTSKKESQIVVLDPKTGKILQTFDSQASHHIMSKGVPSNSLYMTRIKYTLSIFDQRTLRMLGNISFSECIAASLSNHEEQPDSFDDSLQEDTSKTMVRIQSGSDGTFSIEDGEHDRIETKFKSPTAFVFQVKTDSVRKPHLSKIDFPSSFYGDSHMKLDPAGSTAISGSSSSGSGSTENLPDLLSESRPEKQLQQISDTPYVIGIDSKSEEAKCTPGSNLHHCQTTPLNTTKDNSVLGMYGGVMFAICLTVVAGLGVIGYILPNHTNTNDISLSVIHSPPTPTNGLDIEQLEAPFKSTRIQDLDSQSTDKTGVGIQDHAGMYVQNDTSVYPDQSHSANFISDQTDGVDASQLHTSLTKHDSGVGKSQTKKSKGRKKGGRIKSTKSTVDSDANITNSENSDSIHFHMNGSTRSSVLGDGSSSSSHSSVSVSSKPFVRTNPASLQLLSVTDTVLGFGSHGTVVYKGFFEGMDVAIKRLLLDFYEVADHEVKILQESDHHPNIVRYYCREECDGFMYMALELCICTLQDIIERRENSIFDSLRRKLKSKHMIREIMAGVYHLHSMKIVHRDLKPQNILIGKPSSKKNLIPRVLISDFGLGKRLADDQSSFHHTVGFGGGTVGWRAPECLLSLANQAAVSSGQTTLSGGTGDGSDSMSNGSSHAELVRITRSMDIFSCGCIIYYILTDGGHPFGDKFSREMNVLRGNYRLDGLDALKQDSMLAKDLIKRMIAKDPKKRLDSSATLHHPYFWTPSQRLLFIQDVSDRFEIESKDPPSALVKHLERGAVKVTAGDWTRRFSREVMEEIRRHRKYDGTSVQDLLRAIRNKKHHYQELSASARKSLGAIPDGFMANIEDKFPGLLLHCFGVVADSKVLRGERTLGDYLHFG
ncbi:hypothetical protein BASA50_002060 [Batrachochytrium salamandrivorans]|uniref:non-specific serine/threonine protein kinase n=1 Tax=Batrachochytrium salamandrivorans TaxID=1357716 RepID=A0ABQ8FM96_9FUNG|nr:hypothetical protein BASA61_004499 [Batrachochytrium salamandrivorans]KAH6600676.1 hypothetical protein BASA50_002060 [Batrachochytrium salamandrivorans]